MVGCGRQAKGDTIDRTVVSDSEGFYRVPCRPAPIRRHVVDGFQTVELKDIVHVNRTVTLDLRTVASRTEAVTVVAVVPSLKSRVPPPVRLSTHGRSTRSRRNRNYLL